jgi:hypothetical protein
LDLQLPVQSVPITTKVVSSNPFHGEAYSLQHYVIKFVSDWRQVDGFLGVLQFPPPGMKQTYLYLWYLLSRAQWDRCDQRNHQT